MLEAAKDFYRGSRVCVATNGRIKEWFGGVGKVLCPGLLASPWVEW